MLLIVGGVLAFVYLHRKPSLAPANGRVISDLQNRISRNSLWRENPGLGDPVIIERNGVIYGGFTCKHRQEDISRDFPARSYVSTEGNIVVEQVKELYEGRGYRDTSILCTSKQITVNDADSLRQLHPDSWPYRYDPPYFIDDTNTVYYASFLDQNTGVEETPDLTVVPDADAQSFAISAGSFATSTAAVYREGRVVQGADPKTFIAIGHYFKDKNGVYTSVTGTTGGVLVLAPLRAEYPDGALAPPLDGETFVLERFLRNRGTIFEDGQTRYILFDSEYPLPDRLVALYPADADSFHFLAVSYPPIEGARYDAEDDCTSPYAVDGRHVYADMRFISGADPKSFTLLDQYATRSGAKSTCTLHYARDTRAVYFDGKVVSGADPTSFHPIPFDQAGGNAPYGTDGRTVYYEAEPLPGADPKTFQILWYKGYEGCGAGEYAKDANRVYFKAALVPGADAASFTAPRETDGHFGKDVRGYYDGTTFIGTKFDPKKLECSYG